MTDKRDENTPADHAAKWETSLLQAMRPELVNMSELNIDGNGQAAAFPHYDNEKQAYVDMNKMDKTHPLYGILGTDPRVFASPEPGARTVDAILGALETWVRQALASR